ncbi:hypothetical protein L6164_018539 [Bauhinia variegata]|uniref:Uncharacterized protein n=1 Tax=Bauhinia variegata TaxID=167791 RepID=A0ACB9NBL6_BAUVA|nr:hypothetical protein L6164_018539 [Bauhinia variegata]
MWFGDLVDIRELLVSGQDLYVKMATSELGANDGHKKVAGLVAGIVAIAVAAVSGILIFGWCYTQKFGRTMKEKLDYSIKEDPSHERQVEDLDLPLLDLSSIATATNNFSINNKIGEGGFGPVYKGTLEDGLEFAVKRLSTSSGQGLTEFKNEVKLIAKLQHRNLVRLLGCCIQGEEKMLVYEYMPNSSLDSFIFDENKSKLLDWPKRFEIIIGIARAITSLDMYGNSGKKAGH